MPLRCRHAIKKHSLLSDEDKSQKNLPIQYTNSALTSDEQQFQSWTPRDSHENQQNSSDRQSLDQTSIAKPSNTSYFTRHYGWDEIEQNEDETNRLRHLFSIWEAERTAILKLQHDLDRNIFQRTFDYIKRMGQSIGFALWLWVHRPANCSNITNLYHQQQASFSLIDADKSQHFICTPCVDTRNSPRLQKIDDAERQDHVIPSIDSLPDSLWLKHFVLDETEESLPPIARAMKNMLDHNAVIWNSRNEEAENLWPYFIDQNRRTGKSSSPRNKARQRHSSSPKNKRNKTIPRIKMTDSDTKDRLSNVKTNASQKRNTKKLREKRKKKKRSKSHARHRSKSKHRKLSQRSKSKKNKKHLTARTVK